MDKIDWYGIEAYLTDRFAECMREANPNIGDASFDRSSYYVEKTVSHLKCELNLGGE